MNKLATAALVAAFTFGVSSAFAQEASGKMSETEMSSGTMAKHPTSESKMKHTDKQMKKSDSMGMKHEASGAMGQ